MAIKVLIRRKFKETSQKDILAMLIRTRSIAMGMKGYISTETLTSIRDPHIVVLLSMWHSQEDWDNYFNSDARKENERLFAEIVEGETQYEVFKMSF
jgi:heme-degrading monooxygenase HmoA